MTETTKDSELSAAQPTAPAEAGRSGRNTVVLVGFTAITNLADGVLKVALPLIATTLTKSPALVSGVLMTLMLPWLFTALHVGVLVDRADRRALLWIANIARVVVVGILLTAAAMDASNLPMLYVGGLILGVAEVIALTSAAALIPTAVAPPGRDRANSWLTGAETVCNEFIGPFIGGILVAVGAAFALGATVAGYALTTVTLVFLVGHFRAARVEADAPRATIHAQIGEGLRFLWKQRLLRVMTLLVSVLCSLWGAWLALMPLYATQEMGLSVKNYGLLVGALGAGGLVGALIVSTSNRLFGRRRVMFANIFLTSAMVAIPAVSTDVWAAGFGAFLGGLGGGLWVVNSRTVSQTLVSMDMMGRYSAVSRLFGWGSVPLGAGLAGLLAEWFGAQIAFAVFALAALTVIVPFMRDFSPKVAAQTEAKIAAGAAPPATDAVPQS